LKPIYLVRFHLYNFLSFAFDQLLSFAALQVKHLGKIDLNHPEPQMNLHFFLCAPEIPRKMLSDPIFKGQIKLYVARNLALCILYMGCHIYFHNITDSTVARWSGEVDGETSRDISVRLFGDIWGDHPCSP
jgi:hypothetical protein